MKNQKECMPFIGMVLTVCALLLIMTGCSSDFEGDSVKNADTYALEIQAMTGTDQHAMKLKEGDILRIQFETVKGSLSMEIKAPDATVHDAATVTAKDLVGPWHLAEGENDESAVNETFPGAMEFGNSMEITSDGNISWYIGADGGTGTYTLEGNVLSANMTNDFDGADMTIELTAQKDGDQLLLTMDYKGMTLCWSWGDGETGKGGE